MSMSCSFHINMEFYYWHRYLGSTYYVCSAAMNLEWHLVKGMISVIDQSSKLRWTKVPLRGNTWEQPVVSVLKQANLPGVRSLESHTCGPTIPSSELWHYLLLLQGQFRSCMSSYNTWTGTEIFRSMTPISFSLI